MTIIETTVYLIITFYKCIITLYNLFPDPWSLKSPLIYVLQEHQFDNSFAYEGIAVHV